MKEIDILSQNKLTKECIFTALMILMERKTLNEISITELTTKAGVSRMSYYRNYNSKEDIITNYMDEIFEEYLAEILSLKRTDKFEFTRLYFAYFRKHEKLILNLINSDLTNLILERYYKYLHSLFQKVFRPNNSSNDIEEYLIDYLAGGLYTILLKWVTNGMKESDEHMANIICTLSN